MSSQFVSQIMTKGEPPHIVVCNNEKPVKTPKGNILMSPSEELARYVCTELKSCLEDKTTPGAALKLHNTYLDRSEDDILLWQDLCMDQLRSDVIWIREPYPEALCKEQDALFAPFEHVASQRFGYLPQPSQSLLFPAINKDVEQGVKKFLIDLTPLGLLAFLGLVQRCQSFILPYGHIYGSISWEGIRDALFVEENWQRRYWGEDKEALARQAHLTEDLWYYCTLTRLAQQAS